jgi:hypothetical protein
MCRSVGFPGLYQGVAARIGSIRNRLAVPERKPLPRRMFQDPSSPRLRKSTGFRHVALGNSRAAAQAHSRLSQRDLRGGEHRLPHSRSELSQIDQETITRKEPIISAPLALQERGKVCKTGQHNLEVRGRPGVYWWRREPLLRGGRMGRVLSWAITSTQQVGERKSASS